MARAGRPAARAADRKWQRECAFVCCKGCCTLLLTTLGVCLIWVIVLPLEPKITITDAHLTQFNFTNSTLYYNLAFNLTIRNPNKRVGISYRRIRVIGNYQKKRFAMVTLPNTTVPFYQGHKNTTFLSDIVVQGQRVVKFGKKKISKFDKETAAGIYNIDAVLALRLKLRLGTLKFQNYGPENINCKLKLPLTASNGNSTLNQTSPGSSFTSTKCGPITLVTAFFYSSGAAMLAVLWTMALLCCACVCSISVLKYRQIRPNSKQSVGS